MKKINLNETRFFALAFPIAMLVGFSSCKDESMPKSKTVLETLGGDIFFNTLTTAVIAADLDDDLNGPSPLTVFAPTNEAFAEFEGDNNLTSDELLASPDLAKLLTYHIVPANITSGEVTAGPVTSLEGSKFYVSVDPNGGIWINGNAMITAVDKMASNGVIHTLDYVISAPTRNIAEIAVASTKASTPEFTQLVAALSRAGLVDAVSGGLDDNLTVFAPTDAAFQDLYTTLGVAGVNDIPLETLTSVLLYHVVPARAFSQDLRNGADLPTLLEGKTLSVDLPSLKINGSGLITSMLNIHATNGVIHAINKVIIPE